MVHLESAFLLHSYAFRKMCIFSLLHYNAFQPLSAFVRILRCVHSRTRAYRVHFCQFNNCALEGYVRILDTQHSDTFWYILNRSHSWRIASKCIKMHQNASKCSIMQLIDHASKCMMMQHTCKMQSNAPMTKWNAYKMNPKWDNMQLTKMQIYSTVKHAIECMWMQWNVTQKECRCTTCT